MAFPCAADGCQWGRLFRVRAVFTTDSKNFIQKADAIRLSIFLSTDEAEAREGTDEAAEL